MRTYSWRHFNQKTSEKQVVSIYTANSIKVVLKKREKVEDERERLIGKD